MFDAKTLLITGGTGSLGTALTEALLSGRHGTPSRLVVFSRDEAKQHQMAMDLDRKFGKGPRKKVQFRLGDIRNYESTVKSLRDVDIVIHTAALKQVPNCERFPEEAIATNVIGAMNIINAIQNLALPVETVIGISTDKAVEPINAMGMTKALQEKLFAAANHDCPCTRFVSVRYGNVLGSRGSVIPAFQQQIATGGPITITDARMTRFLISIDEAIECIIHAYSQAKAGHTIIPRIKAASVGDIAKALIHNSGKKIEIIETGVRPGEKMDELLITREEALRCQIEDSRFFAIPPSLDPTKSSDAIAGLGLHHGFCSKDHLLAPQALVNYLHEHKLIERNETQHPIPQAAL